MNVPETSFGTHRPNKLPPSVEDIATKLKPFPDAASNALEPCLLFGMIVWLTTKDWLISNTQPYPYGESLSVSLSIIVSSLAAFTISRASLWRDVLIAFFIISCVLYLFSSSGASAYWSNMPFAAILVCGISFPLPADVGSIRSRGQKLPSLSLVRRCFYTIAVFGGVASFVISYDSNLWGALSVVLLIIAAGLSLRSLTRFSGRGLLVRTALIIVYSICIISYWAMSLGPLVTGSEWTWLGNGLASGPPRDYRYCLDSLFEGGVLSALFRGLILTAVLMVNATEVLSWLRIRASGSSDAINREANRALQLSVGALSTIFYMVFMLPILASPGRSGPTSIGYWALPISVASLWIATRALKAAQKNVVPEPYIRVRVTGLFATAMAGGLVLIAIMVALIAFTNALTQSMLRRSDSAYVSFEAMPDSLHRAAAHELPYGPPFLSMHDLLRQSCGAEVRPAPALCTWIAGLGMHDDRSPAALRPLKLSLLTLGVYSVVKPEQAQDIYLNDRDYGAPSPGLGAAAAYYFHKPVQRLSDADSIFLLSDPLSYQAPFISGFRSLAPPSQLATPKAYGYTLLPIPDPNTWMVHHDGAVNQFGEAVGTGYTKGGSCAYTWMGGKLTRLVGIEGDFHSSEALGNNSKGQVVGWSEALGDQHAAMWDANGRVTDLGTLPGYSYSVARSINNKGQVVGYAFNQFSSTAGGAKLDDTTRAFLWQSGRMVDLGVLPGYKGSRAYSINDSGQIAGWVLTNDGASHAMVYQDGIIHDIGTLGGKTSVATDINVLGEVVGSAQRSDGTVTSFYWQNGAMHDIGNYGSDIGGRAWSINASGQVVGLSYGLGSGPSGGGHAYIWDTAHGMRLLTTLIQGNDVDVNHYFQSFTAFSINDNGEILGLVFVTKTRSMVLLTPING